MIFHTGSSCSLSGLFVCLEPMTLVCWHKTWDCTLRPHKQTNTILERLSAYPYVYRDLLAAWWCHEWPIQQLWQQSSLFKSGDAASQKNHSSFSTVSLLDPDSSPLIIFWFLWSKAGEMIQDSKLGGGCNYFFNCLPLFWGRFPFTFLN